MRSRYAAFALGLGEVLVRTLASEHPDRSLPRAALAQALSRARERQRFMGLRILHASSDGADGEVLFFARVFARGVSCSFAELSSFSREADGWRYASGITVPEADLPVDLERLGPEDIRRAAGASRSGTGGRGPEAG